MKKIALFALFFITGCTQYWNKPNTYAEEVAYEKQRCMQESMEKIQGNRVAYEGPCMVAKGYTISHTAPVLSGNSYEQLMKMKKEKTYIYKDERNFLQRWFNL